MFKRKTTIRLGSYDVTVDPEDVARVTAFKWAPIEGEFVVFATDIGTLGNPVYKTLGQVILDTDRFVDLVDRTSYVGQLNYSKKNLKENR